MVLGNCLHLGIQIALLLTLALAFGMGLNRSLDFFESDPLGK